MYKLGWHASVHILPLLHLSFVLLSHLSSLVCKIVSLVVSLAIIISPAAGTAAHLPGAAKAPAHRPLLTRHHPRNQALTHRLVVPAQHRSLLCRCHGCEIATVEGVFHFALVLLELAMEGLGEILLIILLLLVLV